MTSAAVFLDRDGVLNEPVVRNGRPFPPQRLEELVVLETAREACQELSAAGLKLVCVSNQPDIARGTQTRETVDAINDALKAELGLDAVLVCPHDDADGCDCRKPLPGLLFRAARLLELDLARSVMVGDRWRDVDAGRAAGALTVFVDRGYREQRPANPDLTVTDMLEAVEWIISNLVRTA